MRISAVICSYNRDKYIKKSIKSLANQDLSRAEYELIIVNNNSTDNTHLYCQEMVEEYKDLINIRYVVESNQGLSFARNRGLSEAKNELIVYMDDDGVAEVDFLSKILKFFKKNPNAVGVGGKVIPIYETEEPSWLSYHTRMMVTHIDYGEKDFKCYGKKYPPGCNMTYTKEILEQVGGFNEALKWRVDDKYIFYEVQKINNQIYYSPDLKVGHHIDKERIEDANFDLLSKRLGEEEKLRVLSKGKLPYVIKIAEYIIKYLASYLLSFQFFLKKQRVKGIYLLRMRRLALQGLIFS